ncbi:MAG: PKD domain-containing protein [Bacteroidales bacterium]|nr:PKD domain-containing protein [Bacteroidales bacterium]
MARFVIILSLLIALVFASIESNAQKVEVILPKDSSVISLGEVTFSWNTFSKTTDYYQLQIANDSNFISLFIDENLPSNSYALSNLDPATLYFWKIRAYDQGSYSEWSDTLMFRYFNPNVIDSLIVWFKPDSGLIASDTLVIQWNNAVADTMHISQSVEAKQPYIIDSLGIINNYSSINFDGVNDFLQTELLTQNIEQPFSVISFFNSDKTTYSHIYDAKTGGATSRCFSIIPDLSKHQLFGGVYLALNSTYTPGDYCIRTDIFNGINSKIDLYKGSQSSGNGGANTMDGITIGSRWSGVFPFLGQINEIILYDKEINDSLLKLNYEYLRWKYAPAVNLGENKYCEVDSSIITIENEYKSYYWSTGDTIKSITVYSTGRYSLTVTDIFNNTSVDSIYIAFHEVPNIHNIEDTTLCYGDTIHWGTSVDGYNYLWSDFSTDSVLSISNEGTYFFILTDASYCTYTSDTAHITIDTYPIDVSLGLDDTICAGQNIRLKNGEAETISYLWSTGESSNSIVVETAGDYSVTTTNSLSCVARDTVNLDIRGQTPMVDFSFDHLCFDDSVQFTDLSQSLDQSNIVEWQWDFGDVQTGLEQNPMHLYADTGWFAVRLKIITDSLCENEVQKMLPVYSLPVANFSFGQTCTGYNVPFYNQSTTDMGFISETKWFFSETDSTYNISPTHSYTQMGDYNVILSVSNNFGCIDSIHKTVSVKHTPVADFTYTPLCYGREATFFDASQTISTNPITHTSWLSSLGQQSEDPTPTFTLPQVGPFQMQLRAIGVNGCADTIQKSLWVFPNPIAHFQANNLCLRDSLHVTNLSTDEQSDIKHYYWWLDKQLISTNEQLSLLPPDTGNFWLTLKVISESGCENTDSSLFTVFPLPKASFSVSEHYNTANKWIYFTADSLADTWQYEYHFGDDYLGNEANTQHMYTNIGYFEPYLKVQTENACYDSSFSYVKIVQPLLDLMISDLNISKIDGRMAISLRLSNVGNLDIEQIKFKIELNDELTFEEIYPSVLDIGGTTIYTLNSRFYQDISNEYYLCITALPYGEFEDIDLDNNILCQAHQTNEIILKLYPNPVKESMFLLMNSEDELVYNYQITDMAGKVLIYGQTKVLEGLNRYEIDTKTLSSGLYILKIGTSIKKFVKQ